MAAIGADDKSNSLRNSTNVLGNVRWAGSQIHLAAQDRSGEGAMAPILSAQAMSLWLRYFERRLYLRTGVAPIAVPKLAVRPTIVARTGMVDEHTDDRRRKTLVTIGLASLMPTDLLCSITAGHGLPRATFTAHRNSFTDASDSLAGLWPQKVTRYFLRCGFPGDAARECGQIVDGRASSCVGRIESRTERRSA